MVGQQFDRMNMLAQFGQNLKGNIDAGLKFGTLDLATFTDMHHNLFRILK